jgi:alcohol dehydrogenase
MALRSTEPEGICISPAYYPFDETPVPLGRMYTKGVTFHTGRCHARSVLSDVAAAMAAGRLHPERITTRRATWKDAREAMAEPGVKLVVER